MSLILLKKKDIMGNDFRNIVFVTGKSTVNWLSNAKIDWSMQKYGNGHENENANICHGKNARAERIPGELTEQINADG